MFIRNKASNLDSFKYISHITAQKTGIRELYAKSQVVKLNFTENRESEASELHCLDCSTKEVKILFLLINCIAKKILPYKRASKGQISFLYKTNIDKSR